MRWSGALLLFSLALCIGLACMWWPAVPARVPLHFDFAGDPDRYGERGFWSWFLLPTLAVGVALLFGVLLPRWIDWLAERDPALINVPDKQRFLALDVERRRQALRPMLALLRVLGAQIALLFTLVQYATLQVARGTWTRLPTALMLAAIAVLVVTALGSIPLARRAVERAASGAAR